MHPTGEGRGEAAGAASAIASAAARTMNRFTPSNLARDCYECLKVVYLDRVSEWQRQEGRAVSVIRAHDHIRDSERA